MNLFEEIVWFIRLTYQKSEGFIPLHEPVFRGKEKRYIEECIDTTFVSSVGKFVDQFEIETAKYTGAKKAVACVNGTSALHLALLLAGVKRDDEVITQPLTFIATANAIAYTGAHPVFVDVDQETLGLSPKVLLQFLETNTVLKADGCYNKTTKRKVTACVPMHTFGHPCKIDELVTICRNYHIELVEDAAESLGSFYKGQHTGTFGRIGILSFNGNKILTTGGGGMLLFQDEELAKQAKHLTTQAKVPHPWKFFHDQIGYNYRMPNINAALGLAQLEQLDTFLASKRELAEKYQEFFKTTDIQFIAEPDHALSNYWLNCILLHDEAERDAFLEFTNKSGIMTRPVWTLMNKLPMFENCQTFELENVKRIANTLVNIPSSVINHN